MEEGLVVAEDLRDLEEDVVGEHAAHDLVGGVLVLQGPVVFLEGEGRCL